MSYYIHRQKFSLDRPIILADAENEGFGLKREFQLADELALPVKFEFVLNPELQNVYLNFIVGLK